MEKLVSMVKMGDSKEKMKLMKSSNLFFALNEKTNRNYDFVIRITLYVRAKETKNTE